jgi:dipeptidyl aminopeptidase/acylaminoacyl peptidase
MAASAFRVVFAAAMAGFTVFMAGPPPHAQSLRPPTTAEFERWESLAPQARALSPDGAWLAYGITRSNRENELRIVNVGTAATAVAAFGDQPAFSADSRWLAYGVAISETEEASLRKAKKPLHRSLGLRDLRAGTFVVLPGVESFSFSHSGMFVAFKRYAAEPPAGQEASPSDAELPKPGADLVVRNLQTGRDTAFGNVSEFAWQGNADRLAFAVSADSKTGNGVHLFDPTSGNLRVLDSAPSAYSGLSWRKDADDLVVLRSKTEPAREGAAHDVLAWTGIGAGEGRALVFNATPDKGVEPGRRIQGARAPSWSDDGRRVFVGISEWPEKAPEKAKAAEADEPASVDVWHWKDTVVVPRQKSLLNASRQQSVGAVWHLADGRLVLLGSGPLDDIRPIKRNARLAYTVDRRAYAMDRSVGRVHADIYTVELETGARTKVLERVEDGYLQASPGGRYLLYLRDDHYWVFDLTTGAHANLTKAVASSFVDKQSDETVKQKPSFGVAGWTTGDAAVWLYDRTDIWSIAPDGSRAQRLTDGARDQVRHRYVRLDPDADFIDPATPAFVSLFGLWTKQSGYARLQANGSSPVVDRAMFEAKAINGLVKAKRSDVYAYVRQAFDDSPDLFVGDAGLAGAKQVSETNPFQSRYAWGRTELVEYKSEKGERLQGVLHYPAGFEAGRKYPMVVYMYERLSDGLHSYVSPSERAPYNASVFTSRGYFFFQPDIVFRPREPGLSVVECVVPAVKQVIARGQVDAARVGVVGHSWGGFDASYLATHTDVFAASVAGAAITNLVSNYGNFHWSNGIAETDHIETGQQRMEVPIYEDLPAYIRNSAVFNVQNMKTPLLLSVGDGDGTVFWHQGLELYNIARRAGKNVVVVAYAGEDHGLRKKPNQVDYHHRIQQWFDHYLKGEPAAPWITDGVSVLDRERELKRSKPAASPKTP